MPRFSIASAPIRLHRQVLAAFEGRLRWFNITGWIGGVVLFGVGCALAWRFVQAQELREMLRWCAASALAFAGIALVKICGGGLATGGLGRV